MTKTEFIAPLMAACLAALPSLAMAEMEFSFYTGIQDAAHGRIYGTGGTVDGDDYLIDWEGRSFELPPYYGLRATWWQSEALGFGVDVNHVKVYASDASLADSGYDILGFTDGLNIITVNAYRRFPNLDWGVTPYIGAGAGVAMPHVEVSKGGSETIGFQVTGPAVTVVAGASYPLSDTVSVFGEYKGTYSQNKAELDDGGTLEADIVTNAVNLGLSFRF